MSNLTVRTILNWMSCLTLIAAFILLIIIGYWLNAPYNIMKFEKDHGTVLTPIVKQGEMLLVKRDCEKFLPYPAEVGRTFVNGLVFTSPTFITNINTGKHKDTMGILIPRELPVGEYHIITLFRFQPNPIRTIEYTTQTQTFEVIQ